MLHPAWDNRVLRLAWDSCPALCPASGNLALRLAWDNRVLRLAWDSCPALRPAWGNLMLRLAWDNRVLHPASDSLPCSARHRVTGHSSRSGPWRRTGRCHSTRTHSARRRHSTRSHSGRRHSAWRCRRSRRRTRITGGLRFTALFSTPGKHQTRDAKNHPQKTTRHTAAP